MRHWSAAIVGVTMLCVADAAHALQVALPPAPQRVSTPAREKSPMLARVIGVVPGAGHVYAGEPDRGLVYFVATLGIAIVGGNVSDAQCSEEPYSDEYCSSTTLDILTAAAVAGVWGWSIVDAGRAARRTNARRLRVTGMLVERTSLADSRPVTRVGFRVELARGSR